MVASETQFRDLRHWNSEINELFKTLFNLQPFTAMPSRIIIISVFFLLPVYLLELKLAEWNNKAPLNAVL